MVHTLNGKKKKQKVTLLKGLPVFKPSGLLLIMFIKVLQFQLFFELQKKNAVSDSIIIDNVYRFLSTFIKWNKMKKSTGKNKFKK